jgi:hypothetical protein
MAVLGWSFGTLLYSYFYLRLYSFAWPQDGLPLPSLLLPALLFAVVPLAALVFGWAWHVFRSGFKLHCMLGLAAGNFLMLVFLVLHGSYLAGLSFSPQTNAYGSIFFVLHWAVDLLVLIGLGLALTALVRAWREALHWRLYLHLHVQMVAHYAYFAAAVVIVVYGALFLSPYII